MEHSPLVSIGVPTYNRASLLRTTLDSLLSQTYRTIELIVSDNASTDETQKLCEQYAARDSRIRYIRQNENIGPLRNFYRVAYEARGKYFMWSADDDSREPEYIETLVRALETHREYAMAASSFRRVYRNGVLFDEIRAEGKNDMRNKSPFEIYMHLLTGGLIPYSIYVLFRREFVMPMLRRPLARYQSWDKFIILEAVLAGRVYSVTPILFTVTIKHRRDKVQYHTVRFPGERLRPIYFVPYPYIRVLVLSFFRALASPIIPLRRKFTLIVPLMRVVWRMRRKLFGAGWRDVQYFFERRHRVEKKRKMR